MRKDTETIHGMSVKTLLKSQVRTTYSNKVISLKLQDKPSKNILQCSLINGSVQTAEAILERAVNGYHFEEIGNLKEYDQAHFQFSDTDKKGNLYNYRLLIKEKNGVTYYSEIVSCYH